MSPFHDPSQRQTLPKMTRSDDQQTIVCRDVSLLHRPTSSEWTSTGPRSTKREGRRCPNVCLVVCYITVCLRSSLSVHYSSLFTHRHDTRTVPDRYVNFIIKTRLTYWVESYERWRRLSVCLSPVAHTLCSEKNTHSHFLSYLHDWCVDFNKNCSEYTQGKVNSDNVEIRYSLRPMT